MYNAIYMNYEGTVRMEKTTTRDLRDQKNSDNPLQLKKKHHYVVIGRKNKGGEGEGHHEPHRNKKGEPMTFEQAVKALHLTKPFTDDHVTPKELIAILKEDVVLAVDRPGSWEGSNMLTVLTAHGFFIGCQP